MSALVNLPPDVPQDMEQEDVVELLIPGNNMVIPPRNDCFFSLCQTAINI